MAFSHHSIKDGWFREISSQWPGQAQTLKVARILHVEKSQYQDVLVFESTDFGNVLVLDGVIQCTERDEFSYQEMIAHIPLASHPNPRKVLVIGGGDGGVVREVLKHPSVEEVVLCDIDEAVIRVSKLYLPHMSAALSSPRVTTYIGDGLAFLASAPSSHTYDAILTDSSDPVGPARALFEEPFFRLLSDALAPGGVIATQAECLWLHLPLIKQLRDTAREIFASAEYAYTTIPTYPAGQIGYIVASNTQRDLSTPTRVVQGTKYYNSGVHQAAFTLPEFGRAMLEEGKSLLPVLGKEVDPGQRRRVLMLGSGYVALPAAEYILRDPRNELTIACRTLASAEALASTLPRTSAVALDVTSHADLTAVLSSHVVVVSLIPYTHHAAVIRAALTTGTHVVTTSYVNPEMQSLDADVKAKGLVVLNEVGMDPGIDHLYAVKTIGEVHDKGGKIKHFYSYSCGLPAPEAANNPLGYKFSWSPRGVLLALLNSASYISNSTPYTIPGTALMASAKPFYISPAFAFTAYPNRDSTPFRKWYGIEEAETVVRGTLRYQGFPEMVQVLVGMGWMDQTAKDWLKEGMTLAEITQRALGAKNKEEATLISHIAPLIPTTTTSSRIISGLRWVGLLSTQPATVRPTLLDTLCARLEELMHYAEGERDMVMLQHKFVVEWGDGREEILTSTLEKYGDPSGHSAMALSVGVPCGIATQLVLDGEINTPGILTPYTREICDPIRREVEREGLGCVERVE